MMITQRYSDHLTNKQLKMLLQTIIPLIITSIWSLLQKSKLGLLMKMMMSQSTLLELVHYSTKKFKYGNLIEIIHIVINYT